MKNEVLSFVACLVPENSNSLKTLPCFRIKPELNTKRPKMIKNQLIVETRAKCSFQKFQMASNAILLGLIY